jgi:catechol 2,3-dioxygenase-like lactoylglutathione lyase family enzyme
MGRRVVTGMILVFNLGMALAISMPSRSKVEVSPPAEVTTPVLINTCLITSDVKRLAAFYTQALQVEPQWSGDNYTEFRTGPAVLALFAADAQEKYIPGAAKPAQNQSAILEFRVDNVDREYARLQSVVKQWVKPPTTQPWGTRSIYFSDPDGNLVDFFTPPTPR